MTTESALQTARTQLRRAVELLELTENDWQTLSTPRRILEVAVPLRRDNGNVEMYKGCLLYTSPSPRDRQKSRMPSSA